MLSGFLRSIGCEGIAPGLSRNSEFLVKKSRPTNGQTCGEIYTSLTCPRCVLCDIKQNGQGYGRRQQDLRYDGSGDEPTVSRGDFSFLPNCCAGVAVLA